MTSTRIASALVASISLASSACGSAASPAGDHPGTMHTFTSDQGGFDTHSFYYDTGREVVVFDAQFTADYAQQVIADVKAHTASPIRWVVVTHPNPDKFNGAGAFQAIGAKVVASAETAQAIPGVYAYKKAYFVGTGAFTDATYPPQAHIDMTYEGSFDLPLEGGAGVHLATLMHSAVSSTQTVAHIPAIDALVVGDVVHHQAHAWLEGGLRNGAPDPDLASWSAALDELSTYSGTTVYGGRGQTAPVDQAVADEKAYLSKMDTLVADYVAGVADKSQLSGPMAQQHYQAIADLAQQAFPAYDYDYLIAYGVYGLVNQDLAKQ
jgi:glyoxylase-like metal-dependent hydrolase (beta-lactamase superfamily II)